MRGGKLRLARLGTAWLGCMCLAMALAAPAGAYVVRAAGTATLSHARDSSSPKTLSTIRLCREGTQEFGRGVQVFGGLDWGKAIQQLGTSVTITEPFSDPNPWWFEVEVNCARVTSTPPTMATRNTYMKEVQAVIKRSAADTTSAKVVVAECPAGKQTIAGGHWPHGAEGRGYVHDSRQFGAGWRVAARATGAGLSASWSAGAVVLCANVTRPPQMGLHTGGIPRYIGNPVHVGAVSPTNSDNGRFVRATCGPGRVPIGGGADVVGPQGVVLTASFPYYSPSYGNINGWWAAANEVVATSEAWRLGAIAICAPQVPHFP
jgi:hypothetical protein